jgi:hypothetical protein
LGDLTNVRYSTVEQSAIDFVTFSLIPWCRRWEQACRRDLVVDDKTYFVAYDVNSLMAGDYAARSQFLREMWNMGAIDIDELRSQIGYNPLPNGEGKKRFVQVNMQLLSAFTPDNPTAASTTAAAPPDAGGQPPKPSEGEDTPTGLGDVQPSTGAASTEPRSSEAAEVVFRTALRRIAAVEADGVLERRKNPEKLGQWLDQIQSRMRDELKDAAQATDRDIDAFVVTWNQRSRDLLLDCHRSGQKYETATEGWCDKHLDDHAAAR